MEKDFTVIRTSYEIQSAERPIKIIGILTGHNKSMMKSAVKKSHSQSRLSSYFAFPLARNSSRHGEIKRKNIKIESNLYRGAA
jgi:hypothetical protein